MQYVTTFILALSVSVNARNFNNPILKGGDYPDPGTIKVSGTYYIVTTSNNNNSEKFPIHTSTNLTTWTPAGHIFNATNLPSWSNKEKEFWAPEIHKIGENYLAYFTSRDVGGTNRLAIGVAVATHPLGPYKATDRPLLSDSNADVLDATVIDDNGALYFVWKSGDYIKARPLNADGKSFSTDQVSNLFRNDQSWEDTTVEGPWHIHRGEYHYLFYSGQNSCTDQYKIGVARSRNPLGPYEKRKDPILASNTEFKGPGHNSVVKDLDDKNDLLVFHAYKKDEVCGTWPRLTLLASINWGSDDWPNIQDF